MTPRGSVVNAFKHRDSAKGRNLMPSGDDSLPPTEPTLQRAFSALTSVFNERGIRYAIIGGLAILLSALSQRRTFLGEHEH